MRNLYLYQSAMPARTKGQPISREKLIKERHQNTPMHYSLPLTETCRQRAQGYQPGHQLPRSLIGCACDKKSLICGGPRNQKDLPMSWSWTHPEALLNHVPRSQICPSSTREAQNLGCFNVNAFNVIADWHLFKMYLQRYAAVQKSLK